MLEYVESTAFQSKKPWIFEFLQKKERKYLTGAQILFFYLSLLAFSYAGLKARRDIYS